jgi:NhaC family Na+:H+ antiporter
MKDPRSLLAAMLPLLTLLAAYATGTLWISAGSTLALVSLLLAAAVACFQALRNGASWRDIQQRTGKKLTDVLPAICILLSIGVVIGTWVFSGTIPMLVDYGLRLISREHFVVSAFISTAVMSVCTGTSWGSAGTLGVALMGIGTAIGASPAMTAGAVVSGAYFGDKLSPLSDTTNICAIAARVPLYTHVRHLLYTVIPSFLVASLVFVSFGSAPITGANSSNADLLVVEIERFFQVGVPTLLPVLLVLVGIIMRWAAALTLLSGAVLAIVVGITVQGFSPGDAISAAVDGFNVSMLAVPESELSEAMTLLLNRGGANSMASTLILVMTAFLLAAGLELSGGLDRIVAGLLLWARSVGRLVLATLATGSLLVSLTSHASVTALMVGDIFRRRYQDQNLAAENLSRNMEDSVTIVEPLLPWTVSALFMAATLGVPTVEYLPWAVFCYVGPMMAVAYALTFNKTGFGLRLVGQEAGDE